ncbi:DEAD/DEAH box helicase [Paenibacillus antarcticus]|uniref:ATP-dependent RNA helicase CshA n=1 Tax=Paenibacillus antarcticus TaxID=253703 RepID=A0A168QKF4_9BACL|nr:DEAD/DEAH box helicase [Paenibacillus antarcticus]OAB47882.1 DEAD/DEAH box helicase [Paenibacillus antarcticus]
MTFNDLKLIPEILKALSNENYTAPTPIQEQSIPAVLEGRDLLGCAQTGTGKTAAFSLPIIQLLSAQKSKPSTIRRIRSLILTPTRELALQISDNIQAYSKFTDLRCTAIVGGVSQKVQERALNNGADIIIATPGRLIDLINQKRIDLQYVQILVLDEADRMLDMGFIHDVKRIITKMPAKRQTLFFSATMPPEITKMVKTLLNNPVKVEITPVSSTVDRITQSLYMVDKANKQKQLNHLLQDKSIVSALVFTRTKHGADRVVRELDKVKVPAQAIHGNKSQNARQLALSNFRSGVTRVLVATDIAARGIDIDELSHVINFNLPNIPETYVHRIGRTGRAGLSGVAISFCEHEEIPFLKDIEKLIGKSIPEVKDNPFPMLITTEPVKKASGSSKPAFSKPSNPKANPTRKPKSEWFTKGSKSDGNSSSRPSNNSSRPNSRPSSRPTSKPSR